jgi:hypothetical protein
MIWLLGGLVSQVKPVGKAMTVAPALVGEIKAVLIGHCPSCGRRRRRLVER